MALYFLPHIKYKLLFVPIVLLASLIPDIDSGTSFLGKRAIFRPVQAVTTHRGIFHSYTMCIFLTILTAMYYPIYSLGLFIGYSFHLLADSFTIDGIRPFWPLKAESKGMVRSGGRIDNILFMIFSVLSAIFFAFLFI